MELGYQRCRFYSGEGVSWRIPPISSGARGKIPLEAHPASLAWQWQRRADNGVLQALLGKINGWLICFLCCSFAGKGRGLSPTRVVV